MIVNNRDLNTIRQFRGKHGNAVWDSHGSFERTFDRLFSPSSSNSEVYDLTIKGLVKKAVIGYNACVFAYGQTSTGKTYTMQASLKFVHNVHNVSLCGSNRVD